MGIMEVIPMTVGEKIYKLRTYSGLSQKEFADKVGTSQSAINYWENGKRQPRVTQLKKIAKFLDFPLYDLLDDNVELENIELEMKRARPFGASEMTKRPENKPFTGPLQSIQNQHTNNSSLKLHTNSDAINWEQLDDFRFNELMFKLDRGEELTPEEINFKSAYLERCLKKVGYIFAKFYSMLNAEGQKKADEQIDRAIEQVELLTKIPEYQKKPDTPPQE